MYSLPTRGIRNFESRFILYRSRLRSDERGCNALLIILSNTQLHEYIYMSLLNFSHTSNQSFYILFSFSVETNSSILHLRVYHIYILFPLSHSALHRYRDPRSFNPRLSGRPTPAITNYATPSYTERDLQTGSLYDVYISSIPITLYIYIHIQTFDSIRYYPIHNDPNSANPINFSIKQFEKILYLSLLALYNNNFSKET